MNKLSLLAALILVFTATSLGQTVKTQTIGSDADIVKTIKDYDSAWNKKDVDTIGKFLADDYVYFTSDGRTSSRTDTLKFLSSPDYKLTFAERSEIKTYQTGNTAIVSSRWKGRGTYGNDTINDDQRCGIVLTKLGKAWKIVGEHCTQIAAK